MVNRSRLPTDTGTGSRDVDDFLRRLAVAPKTRSTGECGRLIFAMDATASREPTWDRACHIQAEMFAEAGKVGGLEIQLLFYRGFGECRFSPWLNNAEALLRKMTAVRCLGGQTQIGKVLSHALREAGARRVNALVFVGDAVEEDVDRLSHLAGELGLKGVPAFMFHEGGDPAAARAFQHIARLTRGAYCRFDAGSAKQLRDLLAAVAVYAAGGRRALADLGTRDGGAALQLTHQLDRP
jgi:hypothetical protein